MIRIPPHAAGRDEFPLEGGTLSPTMAGGQPPIRRFTACDPVAKRTCARACRRATARNAKRFPDKLRADMPFPVRAIRADGGSGFKADFGRECRDRGINLFELPPRSPKPDGHGGCSNGARRYGFHATWEIPSDAPDEINRRVDAFAIFPHQNKNDRNRRPFPRDT